MAYYGLNLVAIAAILAGLAGFETGWVAASDAFFLAVAGVVLYTASQLMHRNGQPVSRAVKSLLSEPETYPTKRVGQVAYGAAMIAGFGLLVRTLIAG